MARKKRKGRNLCLVFRKASVPQKKKEKNEEFRPKK
jgi:hypothetical protein